MKTDITPQELADLRKDAERYRWLRNDPPWDLAVRRSRKEDRTVENRPVLVYVDGDLLDAEVDAAMAADGPQTDAMASPML